MKKNEQLIGEILLDQLPKDVSGALRVMASLTYPISDRRSFLAQLETLGKDSQKSPAAEQVEALNTVRGAITVHDFPILTPVSGLEKIFAYFSDPYWQDFGPDLNVPDPRDYIESPEIDHCAELRSLFPGRCGDQACDFYGRLIRDGVPEGAARYAAERDGNRCMNGMIYLGPLRDYSSASLLRRRRLEIPRGGPTLPRFFR